MDQRPAEGHRLKGQQYSRVCGSRLRKDSRSCGKDLQEVTQDEHPIDIDRLLVVTFTKAAAAEMRQRVGRAMENALTDRPGDKRLQRQLSLLHNAQITTIDSFCQNIIRNYFHVIDLDPVFRVADDTEIKIMKQEVLEDVLEECYERAANAPEEQENIDYLAMADMLSTGRDDSAVEALVLSMYDMAQSAPWPSDWAGSGRGIVSVRKCGQFKRSTVAS